MATAPSQENASVLNDILNSNDQSTGYAWQDRLKTTQHLDELNGILEQRSMEILTLYEEIQFDDSEKRRCLEEEWIALVMEKDRIFRRQIEEANEEAKRHHITELYQLLETLGTFNFTRPDEAILKRNLAKMYHQIGKYCSHNKIDLKQNSTHTSEQASMGALHEGARTALPPPPPPPPPPPLPPQTPLTHNKERSTKARNSETPLRKRCGSPMKKHSKTTRYLANEEVLNRIRSGCRTELRKTQMKRSPGGTPLRRPKSVSKDDNVNLISFALKKKFENIAMQSPNENDSPRSYTSPIELQ